MHKISVRPLRATDKEQWMSLWAAYNAFYGRKDETALPPKVVDLAWQRLLDRAEPIHGLAAEMDGSLVGLAHFIFHRNMLQEADTCYMQDLFSRPEARGLGGARKLIVAIGEVCQKHGVRDIYWHTQTENVTARSLYDKIATNTEFLVYRTTVSG